MNYVVDKVKEEQKEDVSILTHPHSYNNSTFTHNLTSSLKNWHIIYGL